MEQNKHSIYVHTTPDGRKYVGQATGDLNKRFVNGHGYKLCKAFFNAIIKYGWDNIDTRILATGLSQEEANELEVKYIAILRTNDIHFGFNLTPGGKKWSTKAAEKAAYKEWLVTEEGKKALFEKRSRAHSIKHKPHKQHKTKKLMLLEDGFIGDSKEMAEHIGKNINTVTAWKRKGKIIEL